MIRFHDDGPNVTTAVAVLPPATEVCPECQGAGARAYRTSGVIETCGVCSGTGAVPADGVVHCSNPSCDVVCWADQVCTHTEEQALCRDCAPAGCRACIDERSDR